MSLVVYNVSNPNAHRFSRKSYLNTNPKSVFQFVSIKCSFYILVIFCSSTNENCLSLQYCSIWIGERRHCSYRDYKVLPSQGKWHVIFIHMTVLLCETIVQSTCAVGDHVFFMWFGFIFSYQSYLCAEDSCWPLINLFLLYICHLIVIFSGFTSKRINWFLGLVMHCAITW